MRFLRLFSDAHQIPEYQALDSALREYYKYMDSIRDKIAKEVYDFVVNSWHYDPAHHRSLHDSWLESLEIREESSSPPKNGRAISITLQLLGPYHDGKTVLTYQSVGRYELYLPLLDGVGNKAHGDLLIDEMILSKSGNLVHEILFSDGAKLLIECDTMMYSTDIPDTK